MIYWIHNPIFAYLRLNSTSIHFVSVVFLPVAIGVPVNRDSTILDTVVGINTDFLVFFFFI